MDSTFLSFQAGDPCLNKLHDVVRPDAKEVVMAGTWRFSKVLWSMTRLPPNIPVTDPKPHKAPKKVAVPSHLPEKLMKLDLQCFPDAELPSLHEPGKLRMLEKLYIKGGTKLTGFGKSVPEKPTECSVKVLRLKFLPRLKVEWRELRELYFPKLEFLDKYQSPQREELAKAIADARERQEAQLKDNPLLANPCTACLVHHDRSTVITITTDTR
ncbi:hypothetical protein F2Q69_00061592 [Brassica cretica]|uniref:Uncharacterized protein n=1 Tax=Brassica cretica TaxID=69181 RepID=A0A8S9RIN2_BRACR|nr:hypothetical protein F2Q69_00061592 [Brassica cretica]